MHLILIYLSVIMLLGYVTESKVIDLSDLCSHHGIYDSYLTFGVGYTDISVSIITTEENFSCTLKYTVKVKIYIMLVLEFLDLQPDERLCVSNGVLNNTVTVSDDDEETGCKYARSHSSFRSLSLEKATLQIKNLHSLGTIKITATSMRGVKDSDCNNANETECIYAEKIYCMTKKADCDGHDNCGVPDLFDEDISLCKGKSFTFLMIVASLIMGILTVFLFGSLCLTLLPKRKETFVYRTDEMIPIFDSESEIPNAEIDIKILFSDDVK